LTRIVLELNGEISELDLQLNHILPTQRNKLKDIQTIDIKSFLSKQYKEDGAVSKRLAKAGISCSVTGDTFSVQASPGNMIVIFDNLVINSEYWLDKDEITDCKIFFHCSSSNTVQIWDSGLGVAEEIENSLFEPFQTMKRDGRGLGLYIVQELLSLMNAEIELLQERNSIGRRYKFQITFQEREK
jgi:signal transduction histidine kinase